VVDIPLGSALETAYGGSSNLSAVIRPGSAARATTWTGPRRATEDAGMTMRQVIPANGAAQLTIVWDGGGSILTAGAGTRRAARRPA
jgi:hypothetical protein